VGAIHGQDGGCSEALLNQVVSHFLDKLEARLHALPLSVAVLLILLPETNHNGSGSLAHAGTTARPGQLRESLVIILVGEHELDATHADARLTGLSVAIRGSDCASHFIHFDMLRGAVHLFKRVLVSRQVAALSACRSPQGAIVAVNGSPAAHIMDIVGVRLVVKSVEHLVGVRLPVSHLSLTHSFSEN